MNKNGETVKTEKSFIAFTPSEEKELNRELDYFYDPKELDDEKELRVEFLKLPLSKLVEEFDTTIKEGKIVDKTRYTVLRNLIAERLGLAQWYKVYFIHKTDCDYLRGKIDNIEIQFKNHIEKD